MDENTHYEKVDITQTILANLLWVGYVTLVFVFLSKVTELIREYPERERLILLIVFVFAFTKMVFYLGSPVIRFKRGDQHGK